MASSISWFADEAEAVQVTKKYLSYFQGPPENWTEPDQRQMRRIVPENRLRVYDVPPGY